MIQKLSNNNVSVPRFCLNYKQIPYTTEWIEYPDIASTCKKLGIEPTSKKADGSNHYTLPAIHDPSTGVYIADSLLIAQYLDKTYPSTPPLFPKNTAGLQLAFFDAFWQLFIFQVGGFVLLPSCLVLNPVSQEYFRRTREQEFGVTLEGFVPQGDSAVEQWTALEANFAKIGGWFAKTDDLGPFIMGKEVSWGDIMVSSQLIWLKRVWGEDDQKWKDITEWQGGRWGRFMDAMDKYTAVL